MDCYSLLKEMIQRDVHRDCLSQTPDRRLDSKVNMFRPHHCHASQIIEELNKTKNLLTIIMLPH